MFGKKDALTDLAQGLQKPQVTTNQPSNQQQPTQPYQVVNQQGEVINLGLNK